jgi:hypothetical protein
MSNVIRTDGTVSWVNFAKGKGNSTLCALIVSPEREMRTQLSDILRANGWDAHVFTDYNAAQGAMRKSCNPDLVIGSYEGTGAMNASGFLALTPAPANRDVRAKIAATPFIGIVNNDEHANRLSADGAWMTFKRDNLRTLCSQTPKA